MTSTMFAVNLVMILQAIDDFESGIIKGLRPVKTEVLCIDLLN